MKTRFQSTEISGRARRAAGRGFAQTFMAGALLCYGATSRAAEGPLVAVQEALKQ